MTVWKWFQVLGGHNLDSLRLVDYSFINRALRNELRSYKDPVTQGHCSLKTPTWYLVMDINVTKFLTLTSQDQQFSSPCTICLSQHPLVLPLASPPPLVTSRIPLCCGQLPALEASDDLWCPDTYGLLPLCFGSIEGAQDTIKEWIDLLKKATTCCINYYQGSIKTHIKRPLSDVSDPAFQVWLCLLR